MNNVDKMSAREMRAEIRESRAALDSIRANSAPTAVSLSPLTRIKAFYVICCRALHMEAAPARTENIAEACHRLSLPMPPKL